jgi:hypothetical protein
MDRKENKKTVKKQEGEQEQEQRRTRLTGATNKQG